MNNSVVFLNQQWLWPVMLVGVLLWAVFVWKESSQRYRPRFWFKTVVAFLGMASLVMLVLKPSTWRESTLGKGIILTEGYRPSQLDSLRAMYKRIPLETYAKGKPLSILNGADSLFLLGHGLEDFDLWQLDEKAVAFMGGEEVSGWTAISTGNETMLGETLEVRAKYSGPEQGHWAVLADNGGNPLDSVPFEQIKEQEIILKAEPKASGRFVYHLLERDQEGTLSDEPIPVEIVEGKPLKVLMINTFPTFEAKYLKNFLTERGHEVLARTQLTKGKYKFEFYNGASNPIYGFTNENLASYDLLIIDVDSYIGLGDSSKNALEQAIKSNGLGVFIQPDEGLFQVSRDHLPFKFKRDVASEFGTGETGRNLHKYPFQFQSSVRKQDIGLDSLVVAAYVPMEKGKVGTTLLQNTYQLVLDGEQDLYARIWTQILKNTVSSWEGALQWKRITRYPRKDEPFDLEIRTSYEDMTLTTETGVSIPLLQDALIAQKWTARHYPRKTGWNQLQFALDSLVPVSFFVHADEALTSIDNYQTLKANRYRFGSENDFGVSVSAPKEELLPISPIWFYAVLLLSLGWLWLEPKLIS
ncbi:hypothetical protein [Flagellimonas okinawensis]|uniref:Aerotolerance regulator N-terminal domain-containing protein n=1 Tax=Flagellimonas okinawensis TaxID=3031324 RepID=A0ABT5XTH0_9FLAO|nr:hypothetical protein [[Muricauda] okinawensis]MDF0709164.1 hypothetical protein [[Muricauda] okinawensis]